MRFFTKVIQHKFELALILLLLLAFFSRSVFLDRNVQDRDIYFQYLEAMKIKEGGNPYERIVGQDISRNQKYPTFFPSSYLFILGLSSLVNYDFASFTSLLRFLTFLADGLLAAILLRLGRERRVPFLGLGATIFWLFNRWSLYNFSQARLDNIAIFLTILAIYLYRKESKFWPFLVMSLALGIKHLCVFVLPLFFFDSLRKRDFGSLVWKMALLALIPIATAVPFFLKNPEGIVYSLGFSFTRAPESSNIGWGWEAVTTELANWLLPVLGLVGSFKGTIAFYLSSRIPFFVGFFVLLTFAYLEHWGKYLTAFVGMLAFLSFNPVIFSQYFSWVMPFVLIAGLESFSQEVT